MNDLDPPLNADLTRGIVRSMWSPRRDRLVKIRLQQRGDDVETPWAEDLGPVQGRPGARRVRIGNVPFLHAKPTYEDVVVVEPDPNDGMLMWDGDGVPFEEIGSRIAEDGGRYALIVDYEVMNASVKDTFTRLTLAAELAGIVLEGCYAPRPGKPGRAYLAAPSEMGVDDVLGRLKAAALPVKLTLVHPRDGDG
jgi:hypothetical protein